MDRNKIIANLIIDHVAERLRIDRSLILSSRQKQKIAPVRCICIYQIRANTELKNGEIAQMFGCKSHCMVSNRLSVYNQLLFTSYEFKKMVRISKFN